MCQYTYGIRRCTDVVWEVRIRDSYICGRIPYTPVYFTSIFHQYMSVYILYTDGIRRYTDVVWKVRIRDSYIRGRIPYTPVYLSVYTLYTDGIRRYLQKMETSRQSQITAREQHGKGREAGGKGTGSGRAGYRRWEVLTPLCPHHSKINCIK